MPSRSVMWISFLSAMLRSNAMNVPRGDQAGFESFRPVSIFTRGLTNKGSTSSAFLSGAIASDVGSPAYPCACHERQKQDSPTQSSAILPNLHPALLRNASEVPDLIPVFLRRFPGLLKGVVSLELLGEEIEVLPPGEVGVIQDVVLPGDQIELVV